MSGRRVRAVAAALQDGVGKGVSSMVVAFVRRVVGPVARLPVLNAAGCTGVLGVEHIAVRLAGSWISE